MSRVADERSAAGLASYAVADDLATVARSHAAEMARQGRLHHNPRLSSQVQGWQSVGENVGVGSSVEDVHRAFMASTSHRHAILSSDFTEVGVGIVAGGDGRLWVAQVFRRPQTAAAPAAPAPAPVTAAPVVAAPVARSPRPARVPPPAATPVPTPAPAPAPVPEPVAVDVPVAAPVEVEADVPVDVEVLAASFARWPTPEVASAVPVRRDDASRQVSAPVAGAAAALLLVVLGLLVEVGRYPLSLWRRQRNQASMSSSRSPSSTAWTFPVS